MSENNIVNTNADAQESAAADTAVAPTAKVNMLKWVKFGNSDQKQLISFIVSFVGSFVFVVVHFIRILVHHNEHNEPTKDTTLIRRLQLETISILTWLKLKKIAHGGWTTQFDRLYSQGYICNE